MELNIKVTVDPADLRRALLLIGRSPQEVDFAIKNYFEKDHHFDMSIMEEKSMMFHLTGWCANTMIFAMEMEEARKPKIITLDNPNLN